LDSVFLYSFFLKICDRHLWEFFRMSTWLSWLVKYLYTATDVLSCKSRELFYSWLWHSHFIIMYLHTCICVLWLLVVVRLHIVAFVWFSYSSFFYINSFAAAGDYSRHPGLAPQATSRQRALSAGVNRSWHMLHIYCILMGCGKLRTVIYFHKINWRQKS